MILTYLLVIKGLGSFTGIRIGLSTIKAFCDVINKPCVGITSLEGFAYKSCNMLNLDFTDEHCSPLQTTIEYYICSLLNANHGNAYCGIFKFDNEKLVQTHDYFFDSIDNILNFVNNLQKNIFFVGNCSKFLLDMIEFNKNEAWKICEALGQTQSLPLQVDLFNKISATDIGRSAFDKFNIGDYGNSDFLTPLYLKKSSAESTGTN